MTATSNHNIAQLKLYGAPRTRALRVAWFLEELDLPYVLERVVFQPTSDRFFIQQTPTGKIPTLVDADTVLCESGAIIQYVAARYGGGTLVPDVADTCYGEYLQWFHFAESSAFAPLGVVVWLTVYRDDASRHAELVADAVGRAMQSLSYLEDYMEGREYLVGGFSAADIMMGFTLGAAGQLKLLENLPNSLQYFERITARPAYRAAFAKLHD